MAQPLEKPEPFASSTIDEAAAQLKQAFTRLEAAVASAQARQHSLKADREKLNHLLRDAEKESARLKEVAGIVSKRLDQTISTLEKLEA